MFDNHSCSGPRAVDRQVPICPICDKPVAFRVGESLDQAVNQHIEQNCITNREKVYKHRCNAKDCKKKELIQLDCDVCKKNHCIKHRHPKDHDCTGPPPRPAFSASSFLPSNFTNKPMFSNTKQQATKAVNSFMTMFRGNNSNTRTTSSSTSSSTSSHLPTARTANGTYSNIQDQNLSEEEALNIAIAQSLSMEQKSGK